MIKVGKFLYSDVYVTESVLSKSGWSVDIIKDSVKDLSSEDYREMGDGRFEIAASVYIQNDKEFPMYWEGYFEDGIMIFDNFST